MKRAACLLFAACLALAALGLADAIPGGGKSILPPGAFGGFSAGEPKGFGSAKPVPATGVPFTQALRTEGLGGSKAPWDFQLDALNALPVETGDVLLATFWMRCTASKKESGNGRTTFIFQLNGDPWTDMVTQDVAAGQKWQQFFIPFEATSSFQPGKAHLAFRLGYDAQTLEFGGIEIVNYGKSRKVSELPITRVTYDGMEAGAAWRQEAEQRIQTHRMGDLTVKVVDGQGLPIQGAQVQAWQTRSAFWWGTAVQAQLLVGAEPAPGSDKAKYQQAVRTWFNAAVQENALKGPPLSGDWGKDWGWDLAVGGVNWLRQQGLRQRGHVLIWPGWNNSPKFWKPLAADPKALKDAMLEHIGNVAGGMAGSLDAWDVVNEPYANHDITDILGEDSLVEWFKAARQADPKAKLYLNDYSILEGGGAEDTGHRQHYEKTVRMLLAKGAPLQALGMQGHFGQGLTSPLDLKKILDRYAVFGLPITITEYDIIIKDEALAGVYTRDFLTMMYSHPSVDGVLMWGFWDGAHPDSNAPLARKDWSLKPAGLVWRDLVLGKWMTRAGGKSDAQGAFKFRGHLGDYTVKVSRGTRVVEGKTSLLKGGSTLVITVR